VAALNSPFADAAAKLRRDGLEVFIASDRPGGRGDFDIWVSTRATTSGPWSTPVNLTSLNTNFVDFTPSLSPDGTILYFSSVRDGGSGDQDLYAATRVIIKKCRVNTAEDGGSIVRRRVQSEQAEVLMVATGHGQ
jgi:Tol biopolymer transport system component